MTIKNTFLLHATHAINMLYKFSDNLGINNSLLPSEKIKALHRRESVYNFSRIAKTGILTIIFVYFVFFWNYICEKKRQKNYDLLFN